jgi:glycosyltransferase involved in cell wall biosynthesis
MPSVLFYDPLCREPYDSDTLNERASGGTEASVTRIADALGACVAQHNRSEDKGSYRRPGRIAGIEHVVVVRDSRALPMLRELYPRAQFYLWVHDQMNPGSTRARRLASTKAVLRDVAVKIVCVSDWQRRRVEATLAGIGLTGHVTTRTIYNPVADELTADHGPVDADRLVFFSSPNKGLAYALDVFSALRRRIPSLRLLVGNPAYKRDRTDGREGVHYLGAQPQARMHASVRGALCTFAPNFVLPETFGLVYAESKALGTPVLAHACGAAAEVIGDPRQVLPVRSGYRTYETAVHSLPPAWRRGPARIADRLGLFDTYVERIAAWRSGERPQVGPDPRFMLSSVAAQWRALLQPARTIL